ncbi:hypothetical protein EXIGUO8A_590051 [Exiguobacterium sp. 8A]|uniref:hypothetical protein n=1 Tax=Exiguobacterium sp. 8A TaxID=2653139 RepID=UPI0012F3AF5A|nr:hypothetical protein [Exiguobacterium sp. 8A]VXC01211.1 hypothetical protein EXIGUO8A_590051 [Exiguobacterium sp. 8A]
MNPYFQAEQLIFEISSLAIKAWQQGEKRYFKNNQLTDVLFVLNQSDFKMETLKILISTYPDLFNNITIHKVTNAYAIFKDYILELIKSDLDMREQYSTELLNRLNNLIKNLNELDWEIFKVQEN